MKKILTGIMAAALFAASLAGCGGKAEPVPDSSAPAVSATDSTASADDVLAINIKGTVYEEGSFKASPWYKYEIESKDLSKTSSGKYSVVQKDSSGKALATDYFDISFITQSNPPVKSPFMPLDITVAYKEGVASFEILKDTTSLYTMAVTANAPEIAFIDTKTDYSGKTEISWTGTDKDGGDIWYELWYCTPNEDFISIAADTTKTSATVDFDTLPGSDEGYFYLYATDGVNTTELDSSTFAVGYKPPEIISKQDNIHEYKITDEISFDADVYDKQDGWLYEDDQITWSLKGREYTTGSLLWIWPYELSSGEHVFTLTAKNSKGIETTKDFTFKVSDDESALPDDWSREDIKNALVNGFVAPLSNVNAAITRGQFAKLMANLYWTIWEEGSPDPEYEEKVVTDCGEDDYDQFLMVKLGIMDAPGGKFKPNDNITQEAATVAMFKICAAADPNLLEKVTDDKAIPYEMIAYGVTDETGDNAYDGAKKITGRLALVRCNRLYEAIFGEE